MPHKAPDPLSFSPKIPSFFTQHSPISRRPCSSQLSHLSGARQAPKTGLKAECWSIRIFLRPWKSFFSPWSHRDFPPPHHDQKPGMSLVYPSISKAVSPFFGNGIRNYPQEVILTERWRGSPGSVKGIFSGLFSNASLLHLRLWKACDKSHLRCSSVSGNQLLARSNLWASK